MSKRRARRPHEAIALALVLGLAFLAGRSLLEPGFYDAHDNLLNLHRVSQMEACFADGQLPCRWAPDLAFGFGQPVFNYYPPLPSYAGAVLTTLGFSEIQAVKTTLLLALLGAGASMFLLARSFFGPPASVAAAVLYTWAPYRAIDVYVRGALAEAVGLALLPLVFWGAHRMLTRDVHRIGLGVAVALSWGALLLSHLLVVVMASVFYVAWCAAWWWIDPPSRARLGAFAAAHAGGAALAGFFLLPAVWERDLVQLDVLTTLYPWNDVTRNFLSPDQLLLAGRDWGYGAFGTADGMSLFAGGLHWGAAAIAIAALAWRMHSGAEGRREPRAIATGLMAVIAGASLLMTLPLSGLAWQLPGLAFLQFPWRFLGIAALGLAFSAGYAIDALAERAGLERAAAALAALLAVATSWSYFQPSQMHVVASETLLTKGNLARNRHGAFDYLPRGVDLEALAEASGRRDPEPVRVVSGAAALEDVNRSSQSVAFTAEVSGTRDAVLRLHVFDFPGWRLELDGAPTPVEVVADPLARIHVRVPPGRHRVRAVFRNTPVRTLANLVTAGALFGGGLLTASRGRARWTGGPTQ